MPKIFAPSKNTKKITENRAEKESNLILIVHILVWQKNWDKSTFLLCVSWPQLGWGSFFIVPFSKLVQNVMSLVHSKRAGFVSLKIRFSSCII